MADGGGRQGSRRAGRIEPLVVGAILGVVAIAGVLAIARGGSLGYDEAVYASKARSLVTDTPASGWAVYRPPGLPLLAVLVAPFGFTDATLRLLTLGLGVLTLLVLWGLARRTSGRAAAIVALVAVLGCPVVLTELRTFHDDLPAVGFLLLLMLLLWDQFEDRVEPNGLLLAAGPIAAAAFYLRFGAAVPIASIALAAVLLWGRPMRRHAGLVLGALAIAGVLALPHVITAMEATGSPFGILRLAAEQVDTTPPLDSLIQYVRWLPLQLAGAGLLLILAAFVDVARALIRSVRQRRLTEDARRGLWLLLPAATTAVGLVLVSHPERRYVLLPLVLAIVAGARPTVVGVRWLVARVTRRRGTVAAELGVVALVVGLAAVGVSVASRQIRVIDYGAGQTQWRADAGQAIAADARGPCTAVASLAPLIGWYSGCDTVPFTVPPSEVLGRRPGVPAYLVLAAVDQGRARPALVDAYRALAEPRPFVAIPGGGSATAASIYRIPDR